MSHIVRILVLGVLAFGVSGLQTGNALAQAAPYIVVDARSGKIFDHRDAFRRWSPASLTKMMTAYVTFKALKNGELTLKSPVRQSKNSLAEPPSKMGYKVGSVLTVDNALKIILVKSANDISVALGETVSGSESAFIARMNAEARRLGMTGTNFTNPHGLPSSNQYTTARDMALLGMALRREFPEHNWRFNVPAIRSGGKLLRSQNVLLGRFNGADGMKTGFVCAAGFNLVGSATRRGKTMISVVLGAKSQNERLELSANILASAFANRVRRGGNVRTLAPYGQDRNVKVNLRPQICSSQAQRARWEIRDDKGRLKISSPHIKARTGELKVLEVALGGATGPLSAAQRGQGVAVAAASTAGSVISPVIPRSRPAGVPQFDTSSALRAGDVTSIAEQKLAETAGTSQPLTAPAAGNVVLAPIPRFRPR